MTERCCKNVMHTGSFRSRQCERKGVVEDGGKFYCKQHSPGAAARLQKKLDQRISESEVRRRQHDQLVRDRVVAIRNEALEEAVKVVANAIRNTAENRDLIIKEIRALKEKP